MKVRRFGGGSVLMPLLFGAGIALVVDAFLAQAPLKDEGRILTIATIVAVELGLIFEVVYDIRVRRPEQDAKLSALLELLQRRPDMFGQVVTLVANLESAAARPGMAVPADLAFTKACDLVRDMAGGEFKWPPSDLDLMRKEYENCRHISAFTGDRDLDWWEDKRRGQRYLEWNKELCKHGKVERVFIVKELSERVQRILAQNKDAHVTVRWITEDKLQGKSALTSHATIFDDHLCHTDQLGEDLTTINHIFSDRSRDVDRAVQDFRELWKLADEVPLSPPRGRDRT